MSETSVVTIVCAIIAAIPPTIAAIAAYLSSLRNNSELRTLQARMSDHIQSCHAQRNGQSPRPDQSNPPPPTNR